MAINTVPVRIIMIDESNPIVVQLSRIPCVDEFIEVGGDDDFMAQVKVVSHLTPLEANAAWVAEVHCERVPDTASDEVANS